VQQRPPAAHWPTSRANVVCAAFADPVIHSTFTGSAIHFTFLLVCRPRVLSDAESQKSVDYCSVNGRMRYLQCNGGSGILKKCSGRLGL